MRLVLRVQRLGLMSVVVVQGMNARCSLLPRRLVIIGVLSGSRRGLSPMFTVGFGDPSCDLYCSLETRRWCSHQRSSCVSKSYLVDPASSHMLVSKIKPCMSKYKLLHSETANGSLNQLWFLRSYNPTWITVAILELIHATKLRPSGKSAFIRSRPIRASCPFNLVTLDNFGLIAWPRAGDVSFKCLPYQLSLVSDMPTKVITGNGESGFDSGEGA